MTWHHAIRAQAKAAGVDLPQATVDELALHLDDHYAAAIADGAAPEDAFARAQAALQESTLQVLRRHAAREARRVHAARANDDPRASQGRSFLVLSSFRMALRLFRQHPSFAFVTVLVLGLGTGAATTVFTVVDSVVLRPLPYERSDRLVTLWDTNHERGLSHDPISPVNFMDYRALPVFNGAAAWWRPAVNLVEPGEDPVRVNTIEVSANLFDVLGVRPQIGSGFPANGPFFARNEPIAVISDRLWRTRYNADPSLIGRPINLSGTPYMVVGIMPAKFHFPDDIDVWQRLKWDLTQHSRAAHFMEAVLRLSDGVTLDQAAAASGALALRLQSDFTATNKGWGVRLVPLLDEELGYYRPALLVLFGAVGLLLLIGCLNVASLLLTRALSREREIAVRVALGASTRQLVTQLLSESFVLSAAGALLGIATAAIALPMIVRLTPVEIPRLEEAAINLRALGLGLAVTAATTILFGLVPALLLLRGHLTTGLRAGERGSSRGARRIYSILVAGEVALACALLVSSALLVRTVRQMTETPTGVKGEDVVATKVQLDSNTFGSWRAVADTHARILSQIRQQPGMIAVGAGNFLPLEVGWRGPFLIEGQPPPGRPEDAPQAQFHSVSEGYFEAFGAEMAQGRSFNTFDTADSGPVVVVNETFVKRYLSGGSGLGRYFLTRAGGIGPLGANLMRTNPPPPQGTRFEIVGVVRDVRNAPLGQAVEPAVYFSAWQFPFRELFVTVRSADRNAALTAVRAALKSSAPNTPYSSARTWPEIFAARTAEPRVLMTVLVFFGALAAMLAAIGVYGLFSWSVALRTRELAIRITLGAKPRSVGALVMRHGAVLIGLGLVAGLLIVRVAESALTRVLFEVKASDVGSHLAAGGVLLAAALVACIPPALRAMRVDPVEGLRIE
jgi:putative ABC transport system permease protein